MARADVQSVIMSTTKTGTTKTDRASSTRPRHRHQPYLRPNSDLKLTHSNRDALTSTLTAHHTRAKLPPQPSPCSLAFTHRFRGDPGLKLLPDSEDKDKNEDSTSTCHSSSIDHAVKEIGLSVKSRSQYSSTHCDEPLARTRKRYAWRVKKLGKK